MLGPRSSDDLRADAFMVGMLALWVAVLAPGIGSGPSVGLLLVLGIWTLYAIDARVQRRRHPRPDASRTPSRGVELGH